MLPSKPRPTRAVEYGLSVAPAERDALDKLLAVGGAELSCVAADTTSRRRTAPGNPSAAADQFSITADMTPVPGPLA